MTQFPKVFAGQIGTAGLFEEFAPFTVIKPTDQNYTNSTLANDTALALPIAANATYIFVAFFDYEGGTSGSADMKYAFTVPSGTVMQYAVIGLAAGAGSLLGFLKTATGYTANTSGAGTKWSMVLVGTVIAGSTAGTLQAQFAQNTSNATNTIIHAGSAMALIEAS